MSKLSDLSSSLFEKHYVTTLRIVMCDDVVHRKNKDFAKKALKSSGFARQIVSLMEHLSENCCQQILGDSLQSIDSEESFINSFLKTNCRHYVNYHDEKICTVEFSCKIETTIEEACKVPEELLEKVHIEIKTPVGEIQL
tara:strand:+ start:1713 stop:2132 length:420 start_codon:yes stop_codon:yes gene_type:complete